jgi:signal transduction histidine kinase/CheY-like chemotaxis protein
MKKKNQGLLKETATIIPEQYRARFEEERLEMNIGRMLGFAIYVVALQIVLQVANIFFPQESGDVLHLKTANGPIFEIPLMFYVVLSMVTLLLGIVYWILFARARKGKIKGHGTKVFLVHSFLYIYYIIQMTFCTFNILSHQGINGQTILVLLFGMLPILNPRQSIISILTSFAYTFSVLFFSQGIVDANGQTAWHKLLQTDMRAYFIIINGFTILISVFIYRLYVSNFLKSIQLEDSNLHLEETVRERTKELEEKTVSAQAASQAKSRFLTSMSHEIRTPLNAIIGMAQVAKKVQTKEKSDASVDSITVASGHLLGILNDILDMSNIESGKLEIENNRFLLKKVMDEVVSIIGERCSSKGLVFRHNIGELPGTAVLGDKLRLRQILINLLGNSVKFTPEDGEIAFTVQIQEETDADICVEFTVTDTGIGISEEQREKLFIAFEQGSANNMKHVGTGLGLAISQNLVEMMGGRITVDSTPGKGSTFTFKIRLEKAEAVNDDGELVVPDLSGKHILSVEDIEINRMVLAELLAETGAEIDEASDGAEAVEKFKASPEGYYNFVFMDLLMPNMNGHDATRSIRNLEREDAANVPIVALSANAYEEDIKQALEAGMDSHLAKPINFVEVMRVLSEKIK